MKPVLLPMIIRWSQCFIGSSICAEAAGLFLKDSERRCHILQMICNDMDDAAGTLQTPADLDQTGAHDDRPISLEYIFPDDGIGNAGFVFERHEDHALCRSRPLTYQHETGDRDHAAVSDCIQTAVRDDALP